MANNKVTFGLKNVYYAKATLVEDGTWTYGKPVRLYGAQEFSSEVIGGSTPVYGDDSVVATLNQNSGRTLSLTLTDIPDEFKVDILGYRKLENGNLIEVANAPVVTFALSLEFQGDVKARRLWYYLCSVSPVSESTKSRTESVEANTISLTITVRPIEVSSGDLLTSVLASKGDANYDNFFNSVPDLPTLELRG